MNWSDAFKFGFLFTVVGILFPATAVESAQTEPAASVESDTRHISLQPYRVRIELAYMPESRLTAFERRQIESRLPQIIERSAGQKWSLASKEPVSQSAGIFENDWLPLPSSTGLSRISTDAIMKRYPTPAFDKLFLLTVEPAGIGYQIAGREFDVDSRQWGSLVEKTTYASPLLAETGFQVIRDLFSAVVSIENVNGDQAIVSEQASQYLTPDPALGTLPQGTCFRPFFRYLNRKKEVKNIQMIPWTYLILEEANRKYATCRISSGLRGILSSSRRRVEMEAIQIEPRYSETQLSLIPRGTSTQSYAGMRVQISPLNPQEVRQLQIAAKKESEETGKPVAVDQDYISAELLTNRSGAINVPINPEHRIIWLYVRSGKALVANVPYIPGVDQEISLQIPDDRIRLGVEGDLAILNGELIEAVATLSMEMSRIRHWARNNEWEKVDAGIRQLESGIMPRQIFQEKLNVIRVSATEAAQEQNNRAAQSRIASLCRETEDRIDRFLDPSGIVDFKTEIKDLRQLQNENR